MVEKNAVFNVIRGNLGAIEHFSEESARVLKKRGVDNFVYSLSEARYFLNAINYHWSKLEYCYKIVKKVDKKIYEKYLKGKGVIYGESWRQDVMATVFEFDALLFCTRPLFDRLVRVLETPLSIELPNSIKDFVKRDGKEMNHSLSLELKSSWEEWGDKARAYRDCLIHFWTFHIGLERFFYKTMDRKILVPDNPEDFSKRKFTYNKRIQLIDYALSIEEKCNQLMISIFEKIFENLIIEELGESADINYWSNLPNISVKNIEGNHKLPISPALVCDNSGKMIRIPRYIIIDNGRISRDDLVIEKELTDTLSAPFTVIDNPVDDVEIYGAIQKMLEKL